MVGFSTSNIFLVSQLPEIILDCANLFLVSSSKKRRGNHFIDVTSKATSDSSPEPLVPLSMFLSFESVTL